MTNGATEGKCGAQATRTTSTLAYTEFLEVLLPQEILSAVVDVRAVAVVVEVAWAVDMEGMANTMEVGEEQTSMEAGKRTKDMRRTAIALAVTLLELGDILEGMVSTACMHNRKGIKLTAIPSSLVRTIGSLNAAHAQAREMLSA